MNNFFIFFYFFLLLVISIYGIHMYWLILIYLNHRSQDKNDDALLPLKEYPRVTVQLPLFNEQRVAVRLIEAVRNFDWPGEKLHIQILDDSTDSTTKEIERYLKQIKPSAIKIEHIRRGDRHGYKAGALAFGLLSSNSEYVAVFDADNVPRPDFLVKNIRYFSDPKVGMVQTRWSFLNQNESFLCRAQALFLNAHFIIEQQARFLGRLLFNFNGTAGIWRLTAIKEAGGWEFDTLTEDLDLSMRAQLAGWNFIYNNDYDVPTELPNTIMAFKTQQYRWSKGAIQTALKLLPKIIRSRLSTRVKAASIFHLTSKLLNVALLFLAILLIPALYIRLDSGMIKLLLIDLPIFLAATGSVTLFYSLAYKADQQNRTWRDMLALPMLTSLGIALAVNNTKAVVSAFLGRKSAFIRTPKSGSTDQLLRRVPRDYRLRIDRTILVEMALTVYSSIAIIIAFRMNMFFAVPFLTTFCIGFLYFSVKGISDNYGN